MTAAVTTPSKAKFASQADIRRYGEYAIDRRPDDLRPLYRFTGRLSADGSTGFPAEPGRYHLYAGWSCPWSQRVVLEVVLNGLSDVVGVSYVDDVRDGRGWAFRESNGPDPVNGFALLREAYEATEKGFDGHISVPTLWDTRSHRVVSNDYRTIGLDFATEFVGFRWPGVDTYPVEHRDEIEELDRWLGPAVNRGVRSTVGRGPESHRARRDLLKAFDRLDERLADGGFLVGYGVTEADIRLWVTLARYDVQQYDSDRITPPLSTWPHLARYAGWLAQLPAFRDTTRWQSFSAPGTRPSFISATSDRTDA